ncbi:MAG: phosphate/phosphite/phosphonate ABC transporter substrate-binding protein [Desulfobulbaceae bacterium]|nr:phosphate/phosphite/phosphonate ABC transporter substrate-binding protein [Desulfobulbaceae bacterium]
MKRFHTVILLSLLLLLSTGLASAGDVFVIGVAPHTSPRVILEMYAPLRLHMEKTLGMPVEIVTAPNFDIFAQRCLAQEFDIAVTTGHQARLFQKDAHYSPLLTYKAEFKAVVLVLARGTMKEPSDLKEKDVLGLSPASLVTLWGQHWLAENKVAPKSIKYVSASDSVAQLIISGEAVAGFTSLANYQKLAPEVRNQLRILAESKPLAGRVYMLNNRRAAIQKEIVAALWAFAETAEAQKYFETNNLEGYRMLKPNEMEEMDIYADETRKLLGALK